LYPWPLLPAPPNPLLVVGPLAINGAAVGGLAPKPPIGFPVGEPDCAIRGTGPVVAELVEAPNDELEPLDATSEVAPGFVFALPFVANRFSLASSGLFMRL
jgi:hypothetical protein